MIRAAGIMLITGPAGRALFIRRADTGEWCFPGGRIEAGETAEQAAERETREEVGSLGFSSPKPWTRRIKADVPVGMDDIAAHATEEVDFTTFIAKVNDELIPTLNDEHTAWMWASVNEPPEPLHPGCRVALAKLTMDELGVARAMADGDLVSPQPYGSFWLWKIRITGTGIAWRGAVKDKKTGKVLRGEEFCWRDASIYLTPDFLARCNGLPVTFIHSEGATDSKEWGERAVGTVFLPFIENDEVWSIAKVFDQDANTILAGGFSTSPAVFFGADGPGSRVEFEDGTKLLIENKPALLDSIALVPAGVWDKGHEPSGVQNDFLTTTESIGMTDEEKAAADKARKDADAKLDAIMDSFKRMDSRLDAMEMQDRARKDAEEASEKDRKDRARRDAARKDRFDARKDAESDEDFKKRFDADEAAMCDALRKDGEDEEAAKTAAKDARKDAVEEDEKGRSDRARRDSEAREKERMDAARHDSATSTKIADLERQLAAMSARFVPVSAEDRNMLATAQSRADGVAGLFGKRASPPVPGESPIEYRRRLASDFKQHSAKFKDSRLDSMDEATFGAIEEMVYADAVSAARSPDRGNAAGMLIKLQRQDEAGRTITEWTGDNLAWMQTFMTPGRVGRILDPRNNRI